MAENYYARKMDEEKAAQQNLSRKMVAAALQEGIGKKFHDAAESRAWQMQQGVPYGGVAQAGYMQPGYPSYPDPYQTLQPMGGNPMLAS